MRRNAYLSKVRGSRRMSKTVRYENPYTIKGSMVKTLEQVYRWNLKVYVRIKNKGTWKTQNMEILLSMKC